MATRFYGGFIRVLVPNFTKDSKEFWSPDFKEILKSDHRFVKSGLPFVVSKKCRAPILRRFRELPPFLKGDFRSVPPYFKIGLPLLFQKSCATQF